MRVTRCVLGHELETIKVPSLSAHVARLNCWTAAPSVSAGLATCALKCQICALCGKNQGSARISMDLCAICVRKTTLGQFYRHVEVLPDHCENTCVLF